MDRRSRAAVSWTALLVVVSLLAGGPGRDPSLQAQAPTNLVDSRPGVAPGWTVECVDCPKAFQWMTDRSLRRDIDGKPHVAYGWDHLYYAWYDGAAWQHQTIDNAPGVGGFASLALTEEGEAHFSYYDQVNGDLRYARWDGSGQPVIVTVDSAGDVGSYTSIALDIDGHPHISYRDVTNGALKYAHWTGTVWDVATADNEDDSGYYSSLQLDEDGEPHISYARRNPTSYTYKLMYAQLYQGAWDIVIADEDGSVGPFSSLVLDGAGFAHISYYDVTNRALKYNWLSLFGWHPSTVDDDPNRAGYNTSLALDYLDRPYISYCSGRWDLKVAAKPGTGWDIETVEIAGAPYACTDTSLYVVGSDPQPHIAYLHRSSGELKHAYQTGGGWASEPVDSGTPVGSGSSLAVDSDGHPHISYDASFLDVLKYTTWNGAGWDEWVVDSAETGFSSSSLALDEAGYPHVAYMSPVYNPDLSYTRDLRYAYEDAQGWRTTTLSSTLTNCDVSLALDDGSYPHISYCAYSGLWYAHQDAQGWHHDMVDGTMSWHGTSSSSPSLALAADGTPRISYYHPDDQVLKYAYPAEGGWGIDLVDGAGTVGYSSSLALDREGVPHISYLDATNGALKYATRNGAGWNTSPVDSDGDVGDFSSLVLDRNGRPHVSYYDDTNKDLKYAMQVGSGQQAITAGEWQIITVDSEGWVGWYTSLALDAWGNRHISYHDEALGDLKYAFYANEPPVADAGPSQTVMPGSPVSLDGSGSTDPDGDTPLAFAWQQTGGPAVTLSDVEAAAPTFAAPEEDTVLTFELTVTDNLGKSGDPDTVRVTVGCHRVYLPIMLRNWE